MSNNRKYTEQNQRFHTRAAHSGFDSRSFHGFVNPPVVHASTVLFPDMATLRRNGQQYTYGLTGTPTTAALEAALNELEGSHGTVLVPSGLAAISLPLLTFLSAGDHLLVVDSVYFPTRRFCRSVLQRMMVEITYFDPSISTETFESHLRPNTKAVLLEAPGSNTFEMLDVAALSAAAHKAGAVVMMDNTWATPLYFRPLDHGVDVSIHALTKYPAGHSDIMLGSVSTTAECYGRLRETQMAMGINAAPDDAYMTLRGLRTMPTRIERHEKSALQLAQWLETHPRIAKVLHPALPSFEGHELFKRQFSGSTGLFSIVLAGGGDVEGAAFVDALEIFGIGYSWGGFESLALQVELSDRTVAVAPKEGPVIRLQIGLEDVEDLQRDLELGFAALDQLDG
ncbi:cystathionine beta-lyase [Aureimonas fodinaquatilis]|uniref:cystathionine beta-lyase n=1 Tax=Aureimonas fodinaquatilis TaxID=2565783 RepID=UPI001FE85E94|nr:cystathionine beta-lyase [Aureimonas fodinaquatilis]